MRDFTRRSILKTGLVSIPALALAKSGALAQTTGTGYSRQPYYGQVATGCCVPDTAVAGRASGVFRSPHFNRSGQTLSRLKIAVPNIKAVEGMKVQRQWAARIEYPLNNTIGNVITWNGGEQLTIPAATPDLPYPPTFVVSDEINLTTPIPDNAMFWVRLWQRAPDYPGLVFRNMTYSSQFPRSVNNALGETNWTVNPNATDIDTPVARDSSNGNVWAFTGGSYSTGYVNWACVRPLAILGPTRKPSFTLWGDSRVVGVGDTYDDFSNDRGEVERSIGPAFAYINFGIPGLRADQFLWNLAHVAEQFNPHLYLAANYTTNLIENLGGADLISLATDPNQKDPETNLPLNTDPVTYTLRKKQDIWSRWLATSSLKATASSISTLTLPSVTSGNFTNFSQTDATGNTRIRDLNVLLRAGVQLNNAPVRVVDVASAVSMLRQITNDQTQFLWIPRADPYTVDGTHESQAGCYAIHDSGIFDLCAVCQ